MSDVDIERMFQQGVAAIRAGDKAKAREILTKVVEQDQLHEQAWLWLSAATTDKNEQIVCLQNVLTINPSNEIARKGLAQLGAPPPEAPPPSAQPPQPEPPAPTPVQPAVDDAWRANLPTANYVSEASIVKPMREARPRDIFDLANAWLSAMIFRIDGPFREHVEEGPAGHILVSVGISVFLQILGLALLFGMIAITGRSLTPMLEQGARSASEMEAATARVERLVPPALQPAVDFFLPQAAAPAAPQVTPAVVAAFGMLLLVAVVVSIIATFASLIFQAIVLNRVAEWLGGRGSIIPLTQALAIALVPSQIAQLAVWLLMAILPLGVFGTVSLAVSAYQFVQTSNAVNASHRLGIFASMGAVIIGSVAIGAIVCCFTAALTFLLPH